MLTPDKFSEASVYDLLREAAAGRIGIDRRWLRAILHHGTAALPDLVRFGLEDHDEDPVPVDEELMLIFRELRTPEAVPFFIEYLRRNPEDIPDTFLDALFLFRHEALEPLLALHKELEEDEAGEVTFALAAFRIRDPRVLKILLDRLEYDAGDGALCLGLYGDPAAEPALRKMLEEVEDEHLQQDIRDAIGQLGREADVTETTFDIYEHVAEVALPEAALLEEDDLVEMLQSDDVEYRLAAATGLFNRELSEDAVATLFGSAQGDDDERVRAKSWEALSSEVAHNPEIANAMMTLLQDTSAPLAERAGALVGLGQRSNEDAIRPFAEEFYENPETRAAAMSSMWNSLDKCFQKYFPEHLNDPDPDVRKQAISGVGYLGIYDSAEKLREFFDDGEFRPNALFAYALAARTEVSPGRIRSLLRRIDELSGGLTEEETELVEIALDERLLLHGHKPVFHPDEEDAPPAEAPLTASKAGRNDPCPCGSGKKYKKCHGA